MDALFAFEREREREGLYGLGFRSVGFRVLGFRSLGVWWRGSGLKAEGSRRSAISQGCPGSELRGQK